MIIILNSPPGSGKDTIADYFVEHHPEYSKDSFKSALYGETSSFFGLDRTQLIERHNNRKLKEVPYHLYQGTLMSTRDMLIYTSENVIKPNYGKDYLGKLKGQEWLQSGKEFIISDGGFFQETNAVCDKVGFENVVIIRMYRDGYTFKNDSRNYINSSESNCKVVDLLLVDGEVGKACAEIRAIVESL